MIARGRVWRIVGVVVAAISLLSSGACSSDDASTAPAGTTVHRPAVGVDDRTDRDRSGHLTNSPGDRAVGGV